MDWIPVVGAILAALVGATIGGFLRDWWVENYRKPVLKIVDADFVTVLKYRFHRIRIKNTGKRAAKNCIGKITLENIRQEDLFEGQTSAPCILNRNVFAEISEEPLCWAQIGTLESITINRDDTQALDVVKVSDSAIELPSERGWEPLRAALKVNKEYLGEILVTSENADAVRVKFKVVPEEGDVKFIILKTK